MTNLEKFKSMSDKELIDFLVRVVEELDPAEGFAADVAEVWCSSACPKRDLCEETDNCENYNYTTRQEVETWAMAESTEEAS